MERELEKTLLEIESSIKDYEHRQPPKPGGNQSRSAPALWRTGAQQCGHDRLPPAGALSSASEI